MKREKCVVCDAHIEAHEKAKREGRKDSPAFDVTWFDAHGELEPVCDAHFELRRMYIGDATKLSD